jgi:acetolactate synthase-1/3 small subunit
MTTEPTREVSSPTITLLFMQRTGAIDRIMSLLRRRGFPIGGMTVERTHQVDVGRMTLVVEHTKALEQVSRHLRKLPDVLEVTATDEEDAVRREYALVRIQCRPPERAEVMALLSAYGARTVSLTSNFMVLEASGPGTELDALFAELAPYGIEESARTSPMALRRISEQQEGNPGVTQASGGVAQACGGVPGSPTPGGYPATA